MKKILSFILAVAAFFAFQTTAFASYGFRYDGDFSDSKVPFRFMTEETKIVYNKTVMDDYEIDFDEMWPGTYVYVPISMGASGSYTDTIASDKQIKDYKVRASAKTIVGGNYVDEITVVDGKKDKVKDLPAGTYLRIKLTDTYSERTYKTVEINMVLSVNGISYPETRAELVLHMHNRVIEITENTIYQAHSPTMFEVRYDYTGNATFDFGDKITYTSKVGKRAKYYLQLDRSPNQAISEMYPDAYLEFYNFPGSMDTFVTSGNLRIPIERAKFTPKKSTKASVFAYEIVGDQLKALDEKVLSFDSKKNILTLRTKTLGSYVLSDRALLKEVDEEDDNIIYSGYATRDDLDVDEPVDDEAPPTAGNSGSGSGTAGSSQGTTSNPNTGLPIYADNSSTYNPSTADSRPPLFPMLLLAMLSGMFALLYWKKARPFRRSE